MDVFDLVATLTLDSSKYDQRLSVIKKGLGAFAKAGAVAVGVGSTAVSAIVKQSVDAYANYEQLAGGIETLFGSSAQTVINDAQKAFKTAGMSTNQYMETSIQSAAALINSLGGDQAKAAEYMNMSITDMSDNVNKMGTDMEAVQNAYRGFSRGNFTMLDNLALGFAGTKDGMQQLLDKAKEISGVEFDISSYSDIVEAIHIVQSEMGITGTTAKEASETISGSISSMKSAWTNLITGLSDENADIDTLMNDFVESVGTASENLLPRIAQGLKGISQLIVNLAPLIAKAIPKLITEILPSLLKAGAQILVEIVKALPEIISAIWDAVVELANEFSPELGRLLEGVGKIFEGIGDWVEEHSEGIREVFKTIGGIIESCFGWIVDNGELVISILAGILAGFVAYKVVTGIIEAVSAAQAILNAVMAAHPIVLIVTAIAGLVTALVVLWNTNEGFREAVIKIWNAIVGFFTDAWEAIKSVWETVKDFFSGVWDGIVEIFNINNVVDWFGNIFSDAWNGIKNAWSGVSDFFSNIWKGIKNAFGSVADWFKNIFSQAWQAVKNVFSTGGRVFEGIKDGIVSVFKTVVNAIIRGINKVVTIPFEGINWALEKLKGLNILGLKPFGWIKLLDIPQIPELAKGGILKRGQIGLLEGDGSEAVVPLERNTEWTRNVASQIQEGLNNNNDGNTITIQLGEKSVYIEHLDGTDSEDMEDFVDSILDIIVHKVERKGVVFG